MKILDLVTQATLFLKATSPSARLDAELIISDTLSLRREDLYIHSEKILPPAILSQCLQKIERRIQNEPIAYILNKKDFLNYTFFVQPGVLIPRPETELLVEYALHWIEQQNSQHPLWALDLGCGSGCIGLSLLKEVSNLQLVSVDISAVAIATAQKNAELLDVKDRSSFILKNADEMDFRDFDFLKEKGFSGQLDIVISNPPYISKSDPNVQDSVKKFEPHEALYCEEQGLEKMKKWTNLAGSVLRPQGLWIFEIGSLQGEMAKRILQESDFFENIELAQDYSGKDRFLISHKKQTQKSTN